MARKTSFERFTPPLRVAIVAFDGVVLGDLAAPCEVFGRATTAAGAPAYDVRICSQKRLVTSAHLKLAVPWRLGSLRAAHTVIVPGLDDVTRPVSEHVQRALRGAAARGARIASICTGAFVLAATGLLDGLRATTHWLAAEQLQRRFPNIAVEPDVLYVDNGKLLTSAGAAAGLDLCLHLVRRDLGAKAAAQTARLSVMPLERAGGQAQFIAHSTPVEDSGSLSQLLGWLEAHLQHPLSLAQIAKHAGTSTRTLSRRFRLEVGATPHAWIARARVRRAQQLLETSRLSVERVAEESGFRSATVLRQHFRRVVGTSPVAYRSAFRRAV